MRKFCVYLSLVVGLLGVTSQVAAAQTGALVSIQVQFLQNGAILPTQVMTITIATGATCGVIPKVPVPVGGVFITTGGKIVWDDPANPVNADCTATQVAGGTLTSLPLGNNYTATSKFTDDFGGVSLASAPSNSFTRGPRPVPPAPTGVRVTQ